MADFDPVSYMMGQKAGGGGGSPTLAGLTDVDISNPSNGQKLVYNSTSGKWENDAGGSAAMTVNMLFDEQTQKNTLDKTWQEIDTALRAGKIVYVVWTADDLVTNSFVFSAGEPGSSEQYVNVYWLSIFASLDGTGLIRVFVSDTASGYPVAQD